MRPSSEGEPASHGPPPEPQPPARSIRVSAQERDETLRRLQTAFAEDRLKDEEFEARVRATLTARSQEELGQLLADLPAPTVQPMPARRVRSLVIAVMGGVEVRTKKPKPKD